MIWVRNQKKRRLKLGGQVLRNRVSSAKMELKELIGKMTFFLKDL
jgi:hypothetical protein